MVDDVSTLFSIKNFVWTAHRTHPAAPCIWHSSHICIPVHHSPPLHECTHTSHAFSSSMARILSKLNSMSALHTAKPIINTFLAINNSISSIFPCNSNECTVDMAPTATASEMSLGHCRYDSHFWQQQKPRSEQLNFVSCALCIFHCSFHTNSPNE